MLHPNGPVFVLVDRPALAGVVRHWAPGTPRGKGASSLPAYPRHILPYCTRIWRGGGIEGTRRAPSLLHPHRPVLRIHGEVR